MKRAIILLLAVCLLFATACGVKTPTESGAPASTEAPITGAKPDNTPPAELRGSVTDGAYVNELLGLRVALPAGWTFSTEEQIAEVNGLTAELLAGTDVAEIMTSNGQFMDMMMSTVSGSSINLILQPKQSGLDDYTDEMVFQLAGEGIKAQFIAAGMEVKTLEPVTVRLGSGEKTALHMVLSASGVVMDEYQLWFRTAGDYMGVLTVALMGDPELQPILDGITEQH